MILRKTIKIYELETKMIFKKLIKFLTIMSIGFVTSLNVAAARDWDTELEN